MNHDQGSDSRRIHSPELRTHHRLRERNERKPRHREGEVTMTYSLPRISYRPSSDRRFEKVMTMLRFGLGRGFTFGLVYPVVLQALTDRPEGTPQEICEDVTILLQKRS